MKNTRKVLVVLDLDMKKSGQIEVFYAALGKYCGIRDISVDCILPKEPISEVRDMLETSGIKWFVFKRWWKGEYEEPRRNVGVAIFVLKKIIESKYGVVLFNFCALETVILLALFLRLSGKKTGVGWIQHSEIVAKDNGPINIIKNNFSKIRIMSLLINRIYCVSNQVRVQVLAKKVPEKKAVVLYNGIDFQQFQGVKNDKKGVLSEYGLSEDERLLITVANPRKEKGIQVLLDAIPQIKAECGNVKFLIVGDGPYLKRLKDQAKEIGIANDVIFTGSRSDVPRLLSASYIAIQPSLKESFGNSVVEAMAAGIPVVGSSVGGIPEIIEDNITGILVAPGDHKEMAEALISLLKNEQKVRHLGTNARRSVLSRFSLETALENYLKELNYLST